MKGATKAQFLALHPYCCFCGGKRPATTIDHQPARVFFDGKRMPDDALYPACHECQKVSRDAEHLMSLLVSRPELGDSDLLRWQRRHASIRDRYPKYLADIIPSDELARELKAKISGPPVGFSADNMITLDAELWAPIFNLFAKKLTLSMYYRAVRRPLSSSGRLFAVLAPNGHYDSEWDKQINAITVVGPPSTHGGQDLSDQITLRWAYDPDQAVFCGRLTLQSTLIIYGFAAEEAASLEFADVMNSLDCPFDWDSGAAVG